MTLIQIEFVPEAHGTRMTYLHQGFERLPADLQLLPSGMPLEEGYDRGWTELSGRLKNFVEKGNPE